MPQDTSGEGHGFTIGVSVLAVFIVGVSVGIWLCNRKQNGRGVTAPQQTPEATGRSDDDGIHVTQTFDRTSERGQATGTGQPMGVTGNQNIHQVHITGGANNHRTDTRGTAAPNAGANQGTDHAQGAVAPQPSELPEADEDRTQAQVLDSETARNRSEGRIQTVSNDTTSAPEDNAVPDMSTFGDSPANSETAQTERDSAGNSEASPTRFDMRGIHDAAEAPAAADSAEVQEDLRQIVRAGEASQAARRERSPSPSGESLSGHEKVEQGPQYGFEQGAGGWFDE